MYQMLQFNPGLAKTIVRNYSSQCGSSGFSKKRPLTMTDLGELTIAEVKVVLAKSKNADLPGHCIRDFQPAPSSATCWTKFGQVVDSSQMVVLLRLPIGNRP
jgi:hypothetical protein